ncbi:MAG: hypothetical protein CM1200mP9_06160 [Gammaproteobacteria bacterium]|nr:MAG: hypothetical protein CM1200mP9_06160 [Gammaproteobacteria bacterium]
MRTLGRIRLTGEKSMANAQRGFQGMPANTAQLDMIELGDLSFAVEYRHVGVEQGPSVHVFGKVRDPWKKFYVLTVSTRPPTTTTDFIHRSTSRAH